MTYSRVEVGKKEIFPSKPHDNLHIGEIVRGCDLPRAGFDGCLRCAAGRNSTFGPDRWICDPLAAHEVPWKSVALRGLAKLQSPRLPVLFAPTVLAAGAST
jgi:hypothetical protein